MGDDRKPLKKIGALWQRVSGNGGFVYLSGELEINGQKIPVKVFPTRPEWKRANSPDFEIKTDSDLVEAAVRPRAEQPAPSPAPTAATVTGPNPYLNLHPGPEETPAPAPARAPAPDKPIEGLEEWGL